MKWIIAFLIFPSFIFSQEPDWVKNYGQSSRYPKSAYLTGFATASVKEKDAVNIAEINARANLSRNLAVTIKSQIVEKITEINNQSFQSFQSVTESSGDMELIGVSTEIYKKDKLVYALAYISRKDLIRIYESKKKEITDQIHRLIQSAEDKIRKNQIREAADEYMKTYSLYDNLYRIEGILLAADNQRSMGAGTEERIPPREKVIGEAERLLAEEVKNPDDVARAIAYQLSRQITQKELNVMIVPFSYQNTQMSSSFARYLQTALEKPLIQYAQARIVQPSAQVTPRSLSVTRDLATQSGARYLLEGQYWNNGQWLQIFSRLKDVQTGAILASAEVRIDTFAIIQSQLHYKPENFLKLMAEQKIFSEEEIISREIQLEVWTNKGNENLLFIEDEIMKIYVRVNRPVHIRILYNTADGQRVLLLNDYFIDESKANHVVELPYEFQCAPPFGSEMMVVIARTTPFPALATIHQDGYDIIQEQNTRQLAAGVRGMKVKKSDNKPEQTETRLILTTVAK